MTVYLGYGRDRRPRRRTMRATVGFNAYPLRTSQRPWFAPGLQDRATGRTELVACTQQHH